MRLIDADSLIDLVTDSTILGDGFKTAFCALVNGEPTVKVQKTGKWYEDEEVGLCRCDQCQAVNLIHTPFCPMCGTRMECEEE